MSALQTLHDLRARGFQMQTDGEALAILPREWLNDSDRAAIRDHKFELIKLLSGDEPSRKYSEIRQDTAIKKIAATIGDLQKCTDIHHDTPKSELLAKWEARGARLWLGTTTTKDGEQYRTLEYEFDSAVSRNCLKALEKDRFDIQTALVAAQVRELSRSYWESRRDDLSPEDAAYIPCIDWEDVAITHTLIDLLSAKLGRGFHRAVCKATDEIKTKWKNIERDANPDEIHRAALELLAIRQGIEVQATSSNES